VCGSAVAVLRYQSFKVHWLLVWLSLNRAAIDREEIVRRSSEDKKKPCKNCEGKGTLKKGDKVVRCQRCGGTGIKPS
jgi:DnaJ-class molecular chaperone